MDINDFITFLTRLFFLLVAIASIANLIRHRDRIHADIALLFSVLALVILESFVIPLLPENSLKVWGRVVSSMLILSVGYLLLRLVQHFRTVPRWIVVGAIGGMILSWIALAMYPTQSNPPLPQWMLLGLVAYLVLLFGYEAWAFISGAARTTGVTHWRLTLVAIATGLLAVIFLLAPISIALPDWQPVMQPVSGGLGLVSGMLFYLGFASPRPLRRYWQLSELHAFLQGSVETDLAEESAAQLLDRLAKFSLRVVGGVKATVGLWDETEQKLLVPENYRNLPSLDALLNQSLISKVWSNRQPLFIKVDAQDVSNLEGHLAESADASSVFIVPISKSNHPLGLLLVFMRYTSLFPEDDTEILRLLAEQSATDLEYAKLIDEQRVLVQKLNRRTSQLEEANRELEAFTYTVSHDLRAPLRAVDGFGRILNEDHRDVLPADGKETLDLILQNSKQMGLLIDDLLMFSRLGRSEVTREHINMKELVDEVLKLQLHGVNGRKIEVKVSDTLPDVEANRGLLKQALANLISNAIKFTRNREAAEIEIGYQSLNGEPIFFVKDNGVGFDMKYANKLFGVFQRLQNPEDYEGTGVGLAIVQRIIRKHGGQVWAEAVPDQGATFYFQLGEVQAE